MLRNLDMTNGLIMLKHVMMVLTEKNIDRYQAHHMLYDYAQKAYKENIRSKTFFCRIRHHGGYSQKKNSTGRLLYVLCGRLPEQVDAALEMTT
jgi:adenylosuccinate lyase